MPSEFKIPSPMRNSTFESISQGDLKLIGNRGLKNLTIDSFFPAKDYPFSRDKTYHGWEYVEIIESWMDRRIPIRLIATNTPINIAMAIENFEYGLRDGTGDVYYTLSLEEFRFVKLETRKV